MSVRPPKASISLRENGIIKIGSHYISLIGAAVSSDNINNNAFEEDGLFHVLHPLLSCVRL